MLEDKRDDAQNDINNYVEEAGDDVHRIYLECTKHTDTSARYCAIYEGKLLIASSRDPEHDAARALLAMGVTGTFETWWLGSSYAAMRGDIEEAVKWTIVENSNTGPILRRWRPFPDKLKE